MKIQISLTAAIVAIIASIALMGCYSKPFDELKMAGVAMDQARNAEASEYAPNDWDRARMQWEGNCLLQRRDWRQNRPLFQKSFLSFGRLFRLRNKH